MIILDTQLKKIGINFKKNVLACCIYEVLLFSGL